MDEKVPVAYTISLMVKAKEFIIPYSWEERRVCIFDGVWIFPHDPVIDDFVFQGFDNTPELFVQPQPVHVEYCSGNGTWICEQAKNEPHINWLAIEKRFDRARKIWARAKNEGLSNVAVALAEGHQLTKKYFFDHSIDKVFVNFPDPWPKKRHEKHRIIRDSFIDELARILKPKATALFVTDDVDYSEYMIEKMAKNSAFQSQFPAPFFVEAPESYGTSFFDTLFRSQDKQPRMHSYERL